MDKEELTREKLQKDMGLYGVEYTVHTHSWRIPVALGALVLGFAFIKFLWGISVVLFAFAVYHAVRFAIELSKDSKSAKSVVGAVSGCEFSVSIETLSHIAMETIYEPHFVGARADLTKEEKFFYFESGGRWRVPHMRRLYEWSDRYNMSSKGLENTSCVGDRFYFVTVNGHSDRSYIYNTKFFIIKDTELLKGIGTDDEHI